MYCNVINIFVRILLKNNYLLKNVFLLNGYFDSVLLFLGVNDDVVSCVVMLEIIRCFV